MNTHFQHQAINH